MVTTVCHSSSLAIDTTPPLFFEIQEIVYDEEFNILAVYYNCTDDSSGILRVDLGLGKTKHDTAVRGYTIRPNSAAEVQYAQFVEPEVSLPDGIPIWARIRALNNGKKSLTICSRTLLMIHILAKCQQVYIVLVYISLSGECLYLFEGSRIWKRAVREIRAWDGKTKYMNS